jgi:endoglucanase
MGANRNRRDFLAAAGASAAAVVLNCVPVAGSEEQKKKQAAELKPAQTAIPRWRGFNLLGFFQAFSRGEQSSGVISEDDCRWMRDWGFHFIRLPMDYWLWIDSDCLKIGTGTSWTANCWHCSSSTRKDRSTPPRRRQGQ